MAVPSGMTSDYSQNFRRLEDSIRNLNHTAEQLQGDMQSVREMVTVANTELLALRAEFIEMAKQQQKAAALQQATAELIRVRQEIADQFSSHKVIRETMLGVIQATDVALVKKTTISRVSEELMLSTPRYWLAPCLVAVAAWIGNDRDLADRAIKEAMKRDKERTSLAMALICRRNNRVETCHEWLSVYFSCKDAEHFSEGDFAYLNAYLNGVFGPDRNHMCDDYVANWLQELQDNNSNFEESQITQWNNYCKGFTSTSTADDAYPLLKNSAREFSRIEEYVGRIVGSERIAAEMSAITQAPLNQDKLKKDIDNTLVALISKYDSEEEPLRKEERYLNAVRFFEGDSESAKQAILEAENKRKEETIDLVSQMTNILIKRPNAIISEKKTAVTFLSTYIRKGYDRYLTEAKEDFPKSITISVDDWTGSIEENTTCDELKLNYERRMDEKRAARLTEMEKQQNRLKMMFPAAICCGIAGLLCLFYSVPLSLILFAGAAYFFFGKNMKENQLRLTIEGLNREHQLKMNAGKAKVEAVYNQWQEAQSFVSDFESQPVHEIIA